MIIILWLEYFLQQALGKSPGFEIHLLPLGLVWAGVERGWGRAWALEPDRPGSKLGFVPSQPCDFGQVTNPPVPQCSIG